MKPFILKAFLISTGIILVGLCVLFPNPTKALTPLAEEELVELSPSLIKHLEERQKALPPLPQKEFENSICFQRCHKKNDFSPSKKTRKQWIILIEKEGHAIFQKIPWESNDQKDQVLFYLLRHARDSGGIKEGIGIWN